MAREQFRIFPRRFGYYPFIWLIYLMFPILNLQGYNGFKLMAGYGLVVIFTVTYRQLYWTEGKAYSAWLGLQMLLIVVLCIVYSPFNFYMGFFTSNFVGWYTDLRRFKRAFAVFTVMIIGLALLSFAKMYGTEGLFLFPFVMMMLITPFGIRSMNRRRMLEKELDQANEVIREMVKREERMRIARDLHDTMGHTLSLITLKSQLIEKLVVKNPERAQVEAREIQRTSRAALRQVRELVSEMRAVSVAEELAEAGEMLRSAEIALEIDGDVTLPGVPDLTQNILSLCIKEAVTNIVKHSGADLCRIGIGTTAGEVRITVEDNGVGAGLQDRGTEGSAHRLEGNGMKGMAERLALIEGSWTLGPGTGIGAGIGAGIGTDTGIGAGRGAGTGIGTRIGTSSGTGTEIGTATGAGTGIGTGIGNGGGTRTDTGIGTGTGTGSGSGIRTDTGAGTSIGAVTGTGIGVRTGTLLTVVTPRVIKDRKDGDTA